MIDLRTIGFGLLDLCAYWFDCGMSLAAPAGTPERPHAVAVYFHGVLHGRPDGLVDPQEGMTPEFLREFIHLMRAAGYTFVTPDVMFGPNRPAGNLALLSSDDGYRSIEWLLPMLEEESVPLTVFLTTEYSRNDAIYWWDQIYVAGCSRSATKSLLKHRVRSRTERDEALRHLGLDPDAPAFCNSHRLLSPADLSRLAGHPRLCFGNHTRNHLSLPLLEDGPAQDEVEGARRDIEAWTNGPVSHFAFPYGDHDSRTLALLSRCGYQSAFTTMPGQFELPSGAEAHGTHVLPRYRLRADRSAKWQARIMGKGVTVGAKLQTRVTRWITNALWGNHWPIPQATLVPND